MHSMKTFKRRGQVVVLYALLIPIFLLCAGVALDLGWYYLNVSRLQNAADAAVVAGANSLVGDSTAFSNYSGRVKLIHQYPADKPYSVPTEQEHAVTIANDVAANYAKKNLSSDENATLNGNKYTMISNWSNFTKLDDRKVTMEPKIYENDDNIYYVVNLTETIQHLFMPGFADLFPPMEAPVVAVAMLSKSVSTNPGDPPTLTEGELAILDNLKNGNVMIGNWEVQNRYRYIYNDFDERFGFDMYLGAWNMFSDETAQNHYREGDTYRTENYIIQDDVVLKNPNATNYNKYQKDNVSFTNTVDADGNYIGSGPGKTGNKQSWDNSTTVSTVRRTSAASNGIYTTDEKGKKIYPYTYNTAGNPYAASDLDSIDIDFEPDVTFKENSKYLTEDWDLVSGYNNEAGTRAAANASGKSKLFRIHSYLNFEAPYKARADREQPDILWVKIESEAMLSSPDVFEEGQETELNENPNGSGKKKIIRALNSVRQIFININQSNTASDDRPLIIFYDGPERYNTLNSLRDSKPVILNLNANFNGILYMPNSPVVINGNGYDFHGFIVAKKYLRTKKESEFYKDEETGKYYDSASKTTEYFKIEDSKNKNNNVFVDATGNVQYEELTTQIKSYGSYSTFGRTDFTTHNYHLKETSEDNLFLSGK